MEQLILGLSGPPRSGKDSISGVICELLVGTAIRRLSTPLKSIALLYIPIAQRSGLESRKDEPLNMLDTSYRDLQIGAWIMGRDLMGEDWLGHHLVDAIQYCHAPLILVPDFGRSAEVAVLLHAGLNVRQIRVSRPGTTYEGDSREDFTIPGPSNSIAFHNSGSLTELRRNVIEEILPWIAEARRPRRAEAHPSEEPPHAT